MIGLLLVLIVACVVIWLAQLIIGAFAIPRPWDTVLFVLVVLLVLFWVLGHLGLTSGVRLG